MAEEQTQEAARPKRPPPTNDQLVEGLKTLLDLEELDTDLYRGSQPPRSSGGGQGRVFGGQVIAQALMAATRSSDPERVAHSLHAYFMRPGDESVPIVFRVERDFDGRTFATRRVIAIQKGRPILNMAASFQMPEKGLEHQVAMPDVPMPEDLPTENERIQEHADTFPPDLLKFITRRRPIEMRPVDDYVPWAPKKTEPRMHRWFRAVAPIGEDATMHRAILAFATDLTLLGTALMPHGVGWITHKLQSASLDHAVWIHDPDVKLDEWLLFATDSPWSGEGRGYNRGLIFSRDGRLVASTTQEGLIRLRE
ncbi:MAG: acyl-CoA thioesterase [Alphaproteobacteria bacterium]